MNSAKSFWINFTFLFSFLQFSRENLVGKTVTILHTLQHPIILFNAEICNKTLKILNWNLFFFLSENSKTLLKYSERRLKLNEMLSHRIANNAISWQRMHCCKRVGMVLSCRQPRRRFFKKFLCCDNHDLYLTFNTEKRKQKRAKQ